jgi:hypothetical protein
MNPEPTFQLHITVHNNNVGLLLDVEMLTTLLPETFTNLPSIAIYQNLNFRYNCLEMPNILAAVAMGAITVYGALYAILVYTQDAREPPVVTSSIPFIGSMISLARKKTKYYVELKYETK